MEISVPPNDRLASAEILGNILILHWKDEHRSEVPLDSVRRACPCAQCGGQSRGQRRSPLHVLQPTGSSVLRAVQSVGRYALQFFWGDGHDTGIYAFELLRALCECPECTSGP